MDYLIRLFDKEDYARQLTAGQLNMYPAGKYLSQEYCLGRGDLFEGAVAKNVWIDLAVPVYCLVSASAHDDSLSIEIDKRIIRDFCKCGGYAVIFKADVFHQHIQDLVKKYEETYYGSVTYDINPDVLPVVDVARRFAALKDKHEYPLLHKNKNLSYQCEYRFVFPGADVEVYPCECDSLNVPWKVSIPRFGDGVWVAKVPSVCQIEGDSWRVSLNDAQPVVNGGWKFRLHPLSLDERKKMEAKGK